MLITILFWVLLLSLIGKGAAFSFRLTWTLAKIVLAVIFLPVILAGLFLWGFVPYAFPVLLIIGIVLLLSGKRTAM